MPDSPRDLMKIAIGVLTLLLFGIVAGEIGNIRRHAEVKIDNARREAAAARRDAADLVIQTQMADYNARVRVLEGKVERFRRDMWQDKWPEVDERLLVKLQEMTDEIRDFGKIDP